MPSSYSGIKLAEKVNCSANIELLFTLKAGGWWRLWAVLDSVISERENERVNDVDRLYEHENGCRLLGFLVFLLKYDTLRPNPVLAPEACNENDWELLCH